jgi:hypothetical protein
MRHSAIVMRNKAISPQIVYIFATDEEYEDPPNDIAYRDYTFQQKKAWMEARELLLSSTNNRKKDILNQIEEFTMRPREEIPSIPEKVE